MSTRGSKSIAVFFVFMLIHRHLGLLGTIKSGIVFFLSFCFFYIVSLISQTVLRSHNYSHHRSDGKGLLS